MLRRMTSLPSSGQSPGCGTVSPSRVSLRTSQGSTYDSPILSEPKPLAAVFPGTVMPPSCPSPLSPADGVQALDREAGARLGSSLSLGEGRGLMGSPLRSGMTAVPQHFGSTLPRQSQSLVYGADPYGLYQKSALPRPDSLIGQSHDSVWRERLVYIPQTRFRFARKPLFNVSVSWMKLYFCCRRWTRSPIMLSVRVSHTSPSH